MSDRSQFVSHWLGAEAPKTKAVGGQVYGRLTYSVTALLVLLVLVGLVSFLLWLHPEQAGFLWPFHIVLLLACGVLGVVMLFMTRRNVLEPLHEIQQWITVFRSGDLDARVTLADPGEFDEIIRCLNGFGSALQVLSQDLDLEVDRKTKRLTRKTRSLSLLYDVAASVNESKDISSLLVRFLVTLEKSIDIQAACVYLLEDEENVRLLASIGFKGENIYPQEGLLINRCRCGDAEPVGAIRFHRFVTECRCELMDLVDPADRDFGFVAVTLQYREERLGEFILFVDQEGSEKCQEDAELLKSIGNHLGLAIKKAALDKESLRLNRMEERAHLANELHDSLAQTLASLKFQVRVLDDTLRRGDESTIWSELERVENSLDEANIEVRELITHFRAPVDRRGLIPGIETLLTRFRQETGIVTFFQHQWGEVTLSEEQELQIVRIIQEALNNARKHSQADAIRIMLRSQEKGVHRLLIEDDGVGFDEPSRSGHSGEHIGLSVMEERASQINGTLRIESEPGEGVRIILDFSVPNDLGAPGLEGVA